MPPAYPAPPPLGPAHTIRTSEHTTTGKGLGMSGLKLRLACCVKLLGPAHTMRASEQTRAGRVWAQNSFTNTASLSSSQTWRIQPHQVSCTQRASTAFCRGLLGPAHTITPSEHTRTGSAGFLCKAHWCSEDQLQGEHLQLQHP